MDNTQKKRRFSFWKVSLWLIIINVFFGAMAVILIYYVKLPNVNAKQIALFSLSHWLFRTSVSVVFQCFYYYFALNSFYRLIARRARWTRYVVVSLFYVLLTFAFVMLSELADKDQHLKDVLDISLKIFSYCFAAFFHIVFALVTAAIVRQLDEKKDQSINQKLLEQRTLRLEKEKMQADYLFLKAQINPHFLHNTLNFLYARSLPYSAELSEGILTLSEIMRYSLGNHEDGDGKVLLTQEIEHVHNVIRMQQLRFDNTLQVQFSPTGDMDGRRIIPFVLITLVENAFKHGDLKSIDHPVQIRLDVCPDGRLHFVCINKKKTGPKELSTGIGLDNTRKRLELAYGENYSLYIKDQRDLFTVDLTITL